jgi:anion-transporting  ArsA/GET3 family ATPase
MDEQARVVVFCGKGGVGKTTLCLADGVRNASAGLRVLVVTSHPLPELAVTISLDGLATQFPTAAQNLFVVHLDAKELLAEVVRANFPMAMLAGAILDSSLYKNLIEVAPGLKEFYFLVRLQQLAERRVKEGGGGSREFDLLLWDAPASGHFLGTLRAARGFETYLQGPLAAAGAELARFFSQRGNVALLPVTTLEEMAIAETGEMCQALRSEFGLLPERVLMNMVSPAVGANREELEQLRQRASTPALRFAVGRALLEAERVNELAALGAPVLAVERARQWSSPIDLLATLGEPLAALPKGL